MTTYYIGCSGYYYKEWKGLFYPAGLAAKEWFRFYCMHFNTIEINSSFYRIPSAASLDRWYRDSPEDFLFSLKAPRVITHLKRFQIDNSQIRAFYELLATGLQEKLGCILFQLPPSFTFTAERLRLICMQLNFPGSRVVEFRHESWWQQQVFDALQQHNITFCGQSYPGNIPATAVVNNEISYYRFHGKPVLYQSEYSETTLRAVLRETGKEPGKAFFYFNNTWGPAALVNSRQMQALTTNAD